MNLQVCFLILWIFFKKNSQSKSSSGYTFPYYIVNLGHFCHGSNRHKYFQLLIHTNLGTWSSLVVKSSKRISKGISNDNDCDNKERGEKNVKRKKKKTSQVVLKSISVPNDNRDSKKT